MRFLRDRILAGVGIALVVLLVIIGGAAQFQRKIDLPGASAVAVLIAVVVQIGRSMALPEREIQQVASAPDALRPFRRLNVIRERLEWGRQSPDRFRTTIVTMLDELANDRLRRKHRLDRTSNPVAARHLLGPDLDAVLAGQAGERVPDLHEIADFVRRIEAL
jgi:hypothetical protein